MRGFTLVEILVYTTITAVVAGLMVGILLTMTQINQRESASTEVTSQLNFVVQTIGRLTRESSNIEIDAGVSTTTIKLRMQNPAKDPTCISLVSGTIKLAEGPGTNPNNCTSTVSDLSNNRVVVNSLNFKKFTQYPGHDTVSYDVEMTYQSNNPKEQIKRKISSGIARVSAATFDSNLLPGSNSYNVGDPSGVRWQDGAFSRDLYVGGNLFVGASSSTSKINFIHMSGPAFWYPAQEIWAESYGASSSQNNTIGIHSGAMTGVTGTGDSTAYAVFGYALTANDAGDSQNAYGIFGVTETHPNDTGIALYATNADPESVTKYKSTGGTQYGLFIRMSDVSVTSTSTIQGYGIYQDTANPNYFAGNVGIGVDPFPGTKLTVSRDFNALESSWNRGIYVSSQRTGATSSYNGIAGIQSFGKTSVTGSSWSEAYGIYGHAETGDDSSYAQAALGVYGIAKTYVGDSGYALYAKSDTSSTGGTQYGLYILMDDPDVTRFGVYQASNNLNYFAGSIGIGVTNPASKLQVAGGDLGLGSSTATGNQPITIWLTNSSGATRSAGEIVVIGSSNDSFATTTTANVTSVLGVVYDSTIASGAVGRIAIGGVIPVLSVGATTRGQHVITSTTAGRAGTTSTPVSGSSIGRWLESGGSAGLWRALLR